MGGPDWRSPLGQGRLRGAVFPLEPLVHPWQEGTSQVFLLYPTTLNPGKATWCPGHRCPCDITAVSSSTTLPASAPGQGSSNQKGYGHLNHCPRAMGSRCCVRLSQTSPPRGLGDAPWQGKHQMTSKTRGENGELGGGAWHRRECSLTPAFFTLLAEV